MIELGTPLCKWDLAINYGVKTGFNDAFIISAEKKDELIAADPKSAELIRRFFRSIFGEMGTDLMCKWGRF